MRAACAASRWRWAGEAPRGPARGQPATPRQRPALAHDGWDCPRELPELADQITAGTFRVDPVPRALSDVESAWDAPIAPGERIVFIT